VSDSTTARRARRPPAPPASSTTVLRHLGAAEVAAVLGLVEAAAAVDGGDPLAEDARLALRGRPTPGAALAAPVLHLLAHRAAGAGEPLAGYAQARPSTDGSTTAELLVHPAWRRRGVGTSLADRLEGELAAAGLLGPGAVRAWSHTGSPAAAALAAARGYRPVRELHRMERSLAPGGAEGAAPLPPLELPPGVALRAFEPGRDEQAWLHLNARAFAGHPEQGAWTRADLDARTAEPWFDPGDLLLVVDADAPGTLLAAHWTKVAAQGAAIAGEVYVVGVDPEAQGRGLGRAVVLAGLHHLARRGATRVDLYTDGDNAPALRTYTRLGFERVGTDVVYQGPR
jgi:mycothiol synthase